MPRSILILLPLLAAVGCASPAPADREDAYDAMRQVNYREAWKAFERALAKNPNDTELQRRAREAYLLHLIDRQRQLLFERKEEKALEVIARILANDPDNKVALEWRAKARAAMGEKLIRQGDDMLSRERLAEAQQSYQRALEYVPGDERARVGLREVARFHRDRRDHANQHYTLALAARAASDWQRVKYHANVTRMSDPSHEDVQGMIAYAERRLADEQRSWAEQQQRLGYWAAAASAWGQAAELARSAGMPWVEEAIRVQREMAAEAQAQTLFERAEVKIEAERFDEARELLAEADKLTKNERAYLNELHGLLQRREADAKFEQARLLELDHKIEEALEIYQALAKDAPESQAATRAAVLTELLARSAKAYDEAKKLLEAGERDKARELLRQIVFEHSRYKDAKALLEGLQ